MQKAKWKAKHLGSWPWFITESLSNLEKVVSSSFCSSVQLPIIPGSESKKGDETTEPEVAVTHFENEGAKSQEMQAAPRSWKSKETDHLLGPQEGMQA